MIGFTTDEGLLYTGRFHKDPAFLERFLQDWDTCGPINFLGRDPAQVTPGDRERVAELRAGYPPGTPGLTAMFTDAVFAASSHQVARLLAARGRTVYRYLFAYRGSHSLADIAFSGLRRTASALARGLLRLAWGTVEGAAHGDDIIYLFQVWPPPPHLRPCVH
jgi:carboxylesterase type B